MAVHAGVVGGGRGVAVAVGVDGFTDCRVGEGGPSVGGGSLGGDRHCLLGLGLIDIFNQIYFLNEYHSFRIYAICSSRNLEANLHIFTHASLLKHS